MPDYTSFPRNEAGEPLMDASAWRFEQSLDQEAELDVEDFYERMECYDATLADDPNYCDYHDAIHRTAVARQQCEAEQEAI